MTDKTLVLMVGLPRAGKTTWVKNFHWTFDGCTAIVCPDEIRKALDCYPFVAEMEPKVWEIARVMVKALFGAGHDVVFLDATNVTRTRRAEWWSAEWKTLHRYVDTPREVCIRRAREEGREDLVDVINRMADSFEAFGAGEEYETV